MMQGNALCCSLLGLLLWAVISVHTQTAMPTGNIVSRGAIFKQILAEDFLVNASLGQFPGTGAYKNWQAYNGPDSSDKFLFSPSRTQSVSGGIFNTRMYVDNTTTPNNTISYTGAAWAMAWPISYGRYSIRCKADKVHGFSATMVLWPDGSGTTYSNGYVTFPATSLNGQVAAARVVMAGQSPSMSAKVNVTDWRVWTVEWRPTVVYFLIDNVLLGNISSVIPVGPHSLRIQLNAETGSPPTPDDDGDFQVDWVTIHTYEGLVCDNKTTCNSNGVCNTTSNLCVCSANFTGPNCDSCTANNYGPTCKYCLNTTTCSGHGQCNTTNGLCDCTPGSGYTGANCNQCAANYYGSSCKYCLNTTTCSGHGTCNTTTGACMCATGWIGANCSQCDTNYYGPSCKYCLNTTTCTGKGQCNPNNGSCMCTTGYAGSNCANCATNYYGAFPCKYCVAANTCAGHGTCNTTSGGCICYTGYTGASCSQCATNYYGSNCNYCLASSTCSGNGRCNTTNGACYCDAGYTGTNCSQCATNYYNNGTDCSFCTRKDSCNNNGNCGSTGKCVCDANSFGATCIKCTPGNFYNGKSCTPCLGATVSNSSTTACTQCASTQVPNSAHSACVNCDAGYYASGDQCAACDAGMVSDAGSDSCRACDSGTYYVDSTSCSPCGTPNLSSSYSSCPVCANYTYYPAAATSCVSCYKAASQPTITNVTQNFALSPTVGGTVEITGSDFSSTSTTGACTPVVTFDGLSCTNVVVLGPNRLSCKAPANANIGPKSVAVVVKMNDTAITSAFMFHYAHNFCSVNNGGCDALTNCTATIIKGEYASICGPCPSGYHYYDNSVCVVDIAPSCGDGVCAADLHEDCLTCPKDCPSPCGLCGDGTCSADAGESCKTCTQDCFVCKAVPCPGGGTCSGHGTCTDGVCSCNGRYSGPACDLQTATVDITLTASNSSSSSVIVISPFGNKKPTTAPTSAPTTSTPSSTTSSNNNNTASNSAGEESSDSDTDVPTFNVGIVGLREVDPKGQVVYFYNMTDSLYVVKEEEISYGVVYNLSTTLPNNAAVLIQLYIVNASTSLTFAEQNFTLAPQELKITITISHWPFASLRNTFEVDVLSLITSTHIQQPTESGCGSNVQTNSNSRGTFTSFYVEVGQLAFFGQFLPNALADNKPRPLTITNTAEQSSQKQTVIVTMSSTVFLSDLVIDPNFAVLVNANSNTASSSSDACNVVSDQLQQSGLSTTTTIGAVVGACGGAVLIAGAVGIFYHQRRRNMRKKLSSRPYL